MLVENCVMVVVEGVLGKIVMLSLAKKASVLLIAKLYGFPRLYRRMMEMNRRLIKNEATRTVVRDRTQVSRLCFRWVVKVCGWTQLIRLGTSHVIINCYCCQYGNALELTCVYISSVAFDVGFFPIPENSCCLHSSANICNGRGKTEPHIALILIHIQS